jgi:hypothetical protein
LKPSRKPKPKSKSRLLDENLAMVEARLLVERMENEAAYRSDGRRFQRLTDAALKQQYIKCLRRQLSADRRRRVEMDDIAAELSLRSIASVPLPPDLIQIIEAGIRKLTSQEIPN